MQHHRAAVVSRRSIRGCTTAAPSSAATTRYSPSCKLQQPPGLIQPLPQSTAGPTRYAEVTSYSRTPPRYSRLSASLMPSSLSLMLLALGLGGSACRWQQHVVRHHSTTVE